MCHLPRAYLQYNQGGSLSDFLRGVLINKPRGHSTHMCRLKGGENSKSAATTHQEPPPSSAERWALSFEDIGHTEASEHTARIRGVRGRA
jgi:hypothetical protein